MNFKDYYLNEETFYRGGGEWSMPRGTAKDVIDYEINELGNDIKIVTDKDLNTINSKNLIWVTKDEESASDYGDVEPIEIDKYEIIATDNYGGFLINKEKTL